MYKLIFLIIFAISLITGCRIKEANSPVKTRENQITAIEALRRFSDIDVTPIFQPRAAITFSPIQYNYTSSVICTINRTIDVPQIEYHVWRSADGQEAMKTYFAGNKDANFALVFHTKDFFGKRGEYQIEAYGMLIDGRKILLATSTMTFQQYVPILMYHEISQYQGKGIKELFVTPANFAKQMQYLKDNGYTLLNFEQWEDVNKVNKPIFVTFDDGKRDNLNALHILEKLRDDQFQPTATEFVIAGYIDSDSYRLSTSDLKEMVNSGIFSIQSHTMSHAELPKTFNFERELNESKLKIEQITRRPVIAISYPFGEVNRKVVEETNKYYKFATTTKFGQFIQKGKSNELLLMNRIRINNSTTMNEFAVYVAPR